MRSRALGERRALHVSCRHVFTPPPPPTRHPPPNLLRYAISMATLTYRTAGESHGPALIALIEGMPAGVPVDKTFIDSELRRRQGGYGRGGRQKVEVDTVQIRSGVRRGRTIGSPIVLEVVNND